jgi:hypothetical protein
MTEISAFTTSGSIKAQSPNPVVARGKDSRSPKIPFIIFVDAMFTTLFECLFTKDFDVIRQT